RRPSRARAHSRSGPQPRRRGRLCVVEVTRDSEENVTRFLQGSVDSWCPKSWRGPLPGQPPEVTTDAEGRVHLTGGGRDRLARFALGGPPIGTALPPPAPRPATGAPAIGSIHGATFDYLAPPARPIRGVVRDRATGEPLAGVRISARGCLSPALTDE